MYVFCGNRQATWVKCLAMAPPLAPSRSGKPWRWLDYVANDTLIPKWRPKCRKADTGLLPATGKGLVDDDNNEVDARMY